ncbi:MAG: hypothetical protein IE889_01690 [Campylobacterales bacterium]|nr:hypothetical protein [Campylobacterales bacterium]
MLTTKKALGTLLLSALAMSGCVDQDKTSPNQVYIYNYDPNAVTTTVGYLMDSAVKGLNYSCADGARGVTDVSGKFECTTMPATFKLGEMLLGEITADELGGSGQQVKINYLVDEEGLEGPKTIKLAQLLQTLDSDGNPSNGIDVSRYASKYKATHSFDDSIEDLADIAGIAPADIVSADNAKYHLQGNTKKEILTGNITSDTTLTADKIWVIDGLVVVTKGATLTIEPGTVIAGKDGTGSATSYMIIDKGAKIMAEGTEASPIVFTSEKAVNGSEAAVGQWGGLVIIGKAANDQVQPYEVNTAFVPDSSDLEDNSGVLNYVKILNSGITMEQDKEINGLSLVGVGSGTTIKNITVEKSDDDCIEIWGGTVNLSHIKVRECTDDQFDIDDGYAGTVTNLDIHQTATNSGNAGIEMSGDTYATFDGFTIIQDASVKEGGIFFKKDGIGGHFKNGIVRDNSQNGYGAIYSQGEADVDNTTFENVKLVGSSTDARFIDATEGGSAMALQDKFDAGEANARATQTLSGTITSDKTLTSNKIWVLDGLVTVENGAKLTVEPGTVVAGKDGTGSATSYMIVDKGSQIIADGNESFPIIFTSEKAYVQGDEDAVGQWGGLAIIGNAGNDQTDAYEVNSAYEPGDTNLADNSGVLKYVSILNSGITMAQDKEINGLSLIGVGSGTTIENITVEKSDDDCIEIWGGTVDLTDVKVRECTDDQFDIDDGYAGTVRNLDIHQTSENSGNAGIEMSGDTYATFDGFTIIQDASHKEGGIFFKKDGIGGHFLNGTITDNSSDGAGTIHSLGTADIANTTFENITLGGTSSDAKFTNDSTGGSATELQGKFDKGTKNSVDGPKKQETISGNIGTDRTLTSDKDWILDGLVVVQSGATLTIQAGTTIAGKDGTGSATSYMIVEAGGKIIAEGTKSDPIIFTSEKALNNKASAVGQWGGLTIIGNAGNDQTKAYEVNTAYAPGKSDPTDNSGTLQYVKILNSGITMAQDKEINGLSLIGVGSGTTIENITIEKSDDDCIEIWGGTVNLSHIKVRECTDDQFDIDDGYAGTVTDLDIHQTDKNSGNAGIEMSGDTYATFDGFTIIQDASHKEGGIFFKKDGIGGHFLNGTITDNNTNGAGAIHSLGVADVANTTFEGVTLNGSSSDAKFTNDSSGGSATEIEQKFDAGTNNSK